MTPPPVVLRIIQSLAEEAAREDYLAAQAAQEATQAEERTKPVPLPATDRAA